MSRKRIGLAGLAIAALLAGVIRVPAGIVEDGNAALNRGDAEAAYELFMNAFRADPMNEAVNFGLGQAALAKGRFSHAAFAFDRVLAINPGNHRARLELGRAYHAMRLPDLARSQFEMVLATKPPPEVEANVRDYIEKMQNEFRKWHFNGELRLSGFYDDNVNFGPSSLRIDTILGPLEVAPGSQPQTAWGLSGSLGGSAVYDFGETKGWQAAGGIFLYDSVLENAGDYTVAFGRALLGLRHLEGRRTFDLPLKADWYGLGDDPLLAAYGADPSWTVDTAAGWGSVTRATAEYRDYDADDFQDSGYYRLTQMISKRFGSFGRHQASILVSGFLEDAKEKPYDNYGGEAGAIVEAGLPWGMTAYGLGLYRRVRYGGILYPAVQSVTREDDQWQAGGGLRKRIGRDVEIDLGYRHIWNLSSFALYEYDRNITTLGTAWVF